MKLQESIQLSDIYKREEDFSADLAEMLDELNVGKFEDTETESNAGTRKADIVADGEDGVLVVENQFGKADWDHWGRLEAYARLKKADVAVLVAEDFEELMIVTCSLCNEDSKIDWYLIQAQVNSHKELSFHQIARPAHKELSFHQIARPAIDIQTERQPNIEYSEFWAPIREGNGLFAGKPVLIRNEGWISKDIRNVGVCLYLTNQRCYIQLYFQSPEHRDKIMPLFPKSDYTYEYRDSPKEIKAQFPVLDKGKNDRDDWDEIREKLVNMGTDIYNRIKSTFE